MNHRKGNNFITDCRYTHLRLPQAKYKKDQMSELNSTENMSGSNYNLQEKIDQSDYSK